MGKNTYFLLADKGQGGPTPKELIKLLDQCEISQSQTSTPCISPSPSLLVTSQRQFSQEGIAFTGSVPNLDTVEAAGEDHNEVKGAESSQVTRI